MQSGRSRTVDASFSGCSQHKEMTQLVQSGNATMKNEFTVHFVNWISQEMAVPEEKQKLENVCFCSLFLVNLSHLVTNNNFSSFKGFFVLSTGALSMRVILTVQVSVLS